MCTIGGPRQISGQSRCGPITADVWYHQACAPPEQALFHGDLLVHLLIGVFLPLCRLGFTRSVVSQPVAPDAFGESCSLRFGAVHWVRSSSAGAASTSLSLFSALTDGVFVKRLNIDLGASPPCFHPPANTPNHLSAMLGCPFRLCIKDWRGFRSVDLCVRRLSRRALDVAVLIGLLCCFCVLFLQRKGVASDRGTLKQHEPAFTLWLLILLASHQSAPRVSHLPVRFGREGHNCQPGHNDMRHSFSTC